MTPSNSMNAMSEGMAVTIFKAGDKEGYQALMKATVAPLGIILQERQTNAAFRLSCCSLHYHIDGDICTTTQVPLAGER